MQLSKSHLKRWGSIFFILLLLALKGVDLHQLTHDKQAKESCTICQLAHAQTHNDDYTLPSGVAFVPVVTDILIESPEIFYQDCSTSKPCFGLFLNKAPPVQHV